MPTLLSIETATPTCSVALHRAGTLLGLSEMHLEKSHSSLLHVMIDDLLAYAEVERSELAGIALSMGPGSYTGLRIGASAAKGLCYALDIPLVGVDTLAAMAYGVDQTNPPGAWLCPMIDARRMEVFCRMQEPGGQEILPTQALIVEASAFREQLDQHAVYFFGNGSNKCREILSPSPNAHFVDGVTPSARWIGEMATRKFRQQDFEDVAYSVPRYGKAFRTTPPRPRS